MTSSGDGKFDKCPTLEWSMAAGTGAIAAQGPVGGANVVAPTLRERAVVPTLLLVGLVAATTSSLGAPLIPTIAHTSHVSLGAAEWLLTIALLTGALATPVMGRLADGPHQSRVIFCALSVVLAGSVMAAVTSSFTVLVVARGFQGLGLGLIPVTMAISRRHLSEKQSASTIAMLSVTQAVGVGLGYPITGLFAQELNYQAAFWFGAAVVAMGLALSVAVLPKSGGAPVGRFDLTGACLLSVAVMTFILVISEGQTWGWRSAAVIALLFASAISLAIWARYELHIRDPIVDLRQVKNRIVLMADLAGLFISIGMYLFMPIIVEFVQAPRGSGFGFGAAVVVSGCVLIPLSVCTLAASQLAPRFERSFGRRIIIPFGSILFAIAMTVFALDHSALWEAFLVMAIAGLGTGFTYAAMPGFIVQAVAPHETGSALGLYQVLRSIGLAIGSALSAVILSLYTKSHDAFPVVAGFRTALFVGAALCVFTAVLCFALANGRLPENCAGDDVVAEIR
jgi:MFS family permease